MNEIDLGTWVGILVFTAALVAVLGRMVKWVAGHQEIATLVIAPALAALVKWSALGFENYSWPQLVVISIFTALMTGVNHDKIIKPLVRLRGKTPLVVLAIGSLLFSGCAAIRRAQTPDEMRASIESVETLSRAAGYSAAYFTLRDQPRDSRIAERWISISIALAEMGLKLNQPIRAETQNEVTDLIRALDGAQGDFRWILDQARRWLRHAVRDERDRLLLRVFCIEAAAGINQAFHDLYGRE